MSEFNENKVCIIDFDTGNIGSLSNLLEKLSINYCVSNSKDEINNSTHLILPGVGSFSAAIEKLKKKVNISFLEKKVLIEKKPILGICVGMQLMADEGNEFGKHKGLGWLKGSVDLIDAKNPSLPHIGWNSVKIEKDNNIFEGVDSNHDFYFVNSYFFNLQNKNDMIGSTEYGMKFPSVINKDNLYGVQFHPEKSQKYGKKIILNFINRI